jgi:hypothetical protein
MIYPVTRIVYFICFVLFCADSVTPKPAGNKSVDRQA